MTAKLTIRRKSPDSLLIVDDEDPGKALMYVGHDIGEIDRLIHTLTFFGAFDAHMAELEMERRKEKGKNIC